MRNFTILFVVFLTLLSTLKAQSPEMFNYQTVIRNSDGEAVSNQNVNFRLNILENFSDGATVFSETQMSKSTSYGVCNLKIGNGDNISGSLGAINWGNNDYYLKIEVDVEGADNFIHIGTVQLLSVPYSLYSNKSASADIAKQLDEEVLYFTDSDTLFAVKDRQGNIVFAVFPDGAKVYVNEDVKGRVGGFAISGRSPTKATETDYLHVTPDSTRIYVNESLTKGRVGGFAISGRSPTKGIVKEYLQVNKDSTRIYVEESTKGRVGGFAISGRSPTKEFTGNYLEVTKDSTRVYISEESTKGRVGGFAISGRSPTKGVNYEFLRVTADSTRIFTKDTISGFGIGNLNTGTSESYLQLTPKNYFIGYQSGTNITTGQYNSFFGYESGKSNQDGDNNIFIGYNSGYNHTGKHATITSLNGSSNIFIGNRSGYNSTIGYNNICIGFESGFQTQDGSENTYIGHQSGYSANDAGACSYMGYQSGYSNIEGYGNTYLGYCSGRSTVTASRNTFIGYNSGRNHNSDGFDNLFIGFESGKDNQGTHNTILGSYSGNNGAGENNVVVGYSSGINAGGLNNVILGSTSGNNILGQRNVIIGYETGNASNSGNDNIMIGNLTGLNSTGSSNVFIGKETGFNNTGSQNVIVGYMAGADGNGTGNVFLGPYAGYTFSGNYKFIVDITERGDYSEEAYIYGSMNGVPSARTLRFNSQVSIGVNPTTTSKLLIKDDVANIGAIRVESTYSSGTHYGGAFIATTGSGTGCYAAGSVADFFAAGPGTNYGSSSSKRWKTDIVEMENVLEKVLKMNGVYFTWDEEHGGQDDLGFIAEEVAKYFPEITLADPDAPGFVKGLDYGKMTPILLQAIKEQQEVIEDQGREISDLKKRLLELEKIILSK